MDLSLIIAVAALVFSIASPIVSELIRGRYRLKEKRLDAELERQKQDQEFYRRHRAEVIENFVHAAGQVIRTPIPTTMASFGSASGEIYLYVDNSLWHYVDSLCASISDHKWEEAAEDLTSLCKKLSKEEIRSEYQPEPDRSNKHKPDRV